MDPDTALLSTYPALPKADLVLAHESALVAAGAALQETLHATPQGPVRAAPGGRASLMQTLSRYIFRKRGA